MLSENWKVPGVIESRSLGMKGTLIKILNEKLFDELEKIDKNFIKEVII